MYVREDLTMVLARGGCMMGRKGNVWIPESTVTDAATEREGWRSQRDGRVMSGLVGFLDCTTGNGWKSTSMIFMLMKR